MVTQQWPDPEDDDAAFEADEKARIAALHKSAPEVIWLQVDPEAEQFDGWEAQTWCSDKINDTDVQYVRADTVTPNVKVTGAARLYRAASVWTAGLGLFAVLLAPTSGNEPVPRHSHSPAALTRFLE